jgi:hypothetical protein
MISVGTRLRVPSLRSMTSSDPRGSAPSANPRTFQAGYGVWAVGDRDAVRPDRWADACPPGAVVELAGDKDRLAWLVVAGGWAGAIERDAVVLLLPVTKMAGSADESDRGGPLARVA